MGADAVGQHGQTRPVDRRQRGQDLYAFATTAGCRVGQQRSTTAVGLHRPPLTSSRSLPFSGKLGSLSSLAISSRPSGNTPSSISLLAGS